GGDAALARDHRDRGGRRQGRLLPLDGGGHAPGARRPRSNPSGLRAPALALGPGPPNTLDAVRWPAAARGDRVGALPPASRALRLPGGRRRLRRRGRHAVRLMAMHRVSGLRLEADIPLPELPRASALHASAAITGDGALAFAGKAGWGKSTICASLAHAGGSPLADDCLVIGGRRGRFFAIPSYPGLRLWPDTVKALGRRVHDSELVSDYSEKRRITSRRSDIRRRSPVPLRAIYVLSPPRRRRVIRIARIEPREAVGRLLAHTHRLDLTDRSRLVAELDALSRLAAMVPVFELTCPR